MPERSAAVLAALLLAALLPAASAGRAAAQRDEAALFDALMGKQAALHDLTGVTARKVTQLTGDDSPNRTGERFGVWGTDLGSMAVIGETTYMFCGDTFSTASQGHWRSNVLFRIEDNDPSDGLTITGAVTDGAGSAKELLRSRKIDTREITVIPTNLFAVKDTLYCMYMSVAQWGEPGRWTCGHAGLAKSTDLGETWEKLQSATWPGDSNFVQTANFQLGDTMYFWGIPSGRFGGVALMKADIDSLEDAGAYAYYTGLDADGNPVWARGEAGLREAVPLFEGPVGEISVLYNPFLGTFLMTYLSESPHAIVVREGVLPWGEWGPPHVLATGRQFPSLYGAYMHPRYTEEGGRVFYFAMSEFFPVYNIMWMRAELPAG